MTTRFLMWHQYLFRRCFFLNNDKILPDGIQQFILRCLSRKKEAFFFNQGMLFDKCWSSYKTRKQT